MRWFAALLMAVAGLCAQAADDEAVERRLAAIADELRCLVCQNESLAGSRAALAQDLRREVRSLIEAGRSDAEILDFLVTRYGDFVRYRPALKPSTWLLWGSPFLFMALGVGGLAWQLRRRRDDTRLPLSEGDRERAAALLSGDR
jgi:cytochrome c-type biogenesis protein CcmH